MVGRRALSRVAVPLVPAVVLATLGGVLVGQRQSLWFDELYTAEVGAAGLGTLVRAVRDGTGTAPFLAEVPPSYNAPYYALAHGWLTVTGALPVDVGLRLLSLLAAAGAVAVLALAARRLAGPAVGLAAGLLAATSPLVVEYSAEARGYGLALLATAGAVLGLARWLDGARAGLLLYGVAGAAAGLLQWFALPVLGALGFAALVLRRRAAVPVLAVTALAALPALGLVALALSNGTGAAGARWIRPLDRPLPLAALQAWTGGSTVVLVALVAALAAAVVRAGRTRAGQRRAVIVGGGWLVVALGAVWLADAVRPVFVPRYLLPALLGAALLAGVGVAGGRWRGPLTALLVVAQLGAAAPLLDRGPREDARAAVARIAAAQRPGEPVVAADDRSALALDRYAPDRLRPDLRLPPADPPPDAEVVWLLRRAERGAPRSRTDDDDVLERAGLRPTAVAVLRGSAGDLLVQRWAR